MDTIFYKELSYIIIGAAMEVHKILGPGYLEAVYQAALAYELKLRGISVRREQHLPVSYKGVDVGYYVSNSNYGALFEDGGLQHAKKCKKPPFFLIIAVFGSKMGYKKSNLQKTVHNWNCCYYVADFVVEDKIILELKAVTKLIPQHKAQAINYLTTTGFKLALLINFGEKSLVSQRVIRKQYK